MPDFSDMLRAIRSLYQEKVQQKQGVMTDVGSENARAYSAILAGQKPPEEGGGQTGPAQPQYPNILPPPAAPVPASLGPSSSITIGAPGPSAEPIIAGSQGQPTEPDPVPAFIKEYSDSELRGLINQLHGTKTGRKGSVGTRTKRAKLLSMAADALGYGGNKPRSQSFAPEPPAFTQSEVAAPSAANLPGYESILAGSQAPGESQVAAMGPAGIPQPAVLPPQPPQKPARPLPPSLVSQGDTGAASGPGLGQSVVSALAPQATSRRVTAPPSSDAGSGALTAAAASGPGVYDSILANSPGPVQSHVATSTQGLSGPPSSPVLAEAVQEQPSRLSEVIKRLTDAIEEANRKERTVAQDVQGLSIGQRYERLEKAGNLLSEEEVQKATLKDKVGPRDIVAESERREQRGRDQEKEKKKSAVEEAGETLTGSLGDSVSNLVSRVAGPKAGAAVGQAVQRLAGPAISNVAGSAVAGTAGKAAGGAAAGAAATGLGGVAGRLGMAAMTNPVTGTIAVISATTYAMAKLPGIVERLSSSFVEGQRHLSQYNAKLAATYARLDYQKRILDIQMAASTSGSASQMGTQLSALRKDTQEFKEMWATGKNLWVTGVVQITN